MWSLTRGGRASAAPPLRLLLASALALLAVSLPGVLAVAREPPFPWAASASSLPSSSLEEPPMDKPSYPFPGPESDADLWYRLDYASFGLYTVVWLCSVATLAHSLINVWSLAVLKSKISRLFWKMRLSFVLVISFQALMRAVYFLFMAQIRLGFYQERALILTSFGLVLFPDLLFIITFSLVLVCWAYLHYLGRSRLPHFRIFCYFLLFLNISVIILSFVAFGLIAIFTDDRFRLIASQLICYANGTLSLVLALFFFFFGFSLFRGFSRISTSSSSSSKLSLRSQISLITVVGIGCFFYRAFYLLSFPTLTYGSMARVLAYITMGELIPIILLLFVFAFYPARLLVRHSSKSDLSGTDLPNPGKWSSANQRRRSGRGSSISVTGSSTGGSPTSAGGSLGSDEEGDALLGNATGAGGGSSTNGRSTSPPAAGAPGVGGTSARPTPFLMAHNSEYQQKAALDSFSQSTGWSGRSPSLIYDIGSPGPAAGGAASPGTVKTSGAASSAMPAPGLMYVPGGPGGPPRPFSASAISSYGSLLQSPYLDQQQQQQHLGGNAQASSMGPSGEDDESVAPLPGMSGPQDFLSRGSEPAPGSPPLDRPLIRSYSAAFPGEGAGLAGEPPSSSGMGGVSVMGASPSPQPGSVDQYNAFSIDLSGVLNFGGAADNGSHYDMIDDDDDDPFHFSPSLSFDDE
ncbi:hypothetical protein H696_00373 [Fonticula alba]|uniref:THH1/TOM1/TOM3 domain-containing protein n=1 Tax=Fonticula alba TaxID=691883 RepID=A0A058ZEJ7_FONAL|nr:hypothetical protein H696_00373 [Fonticula alba]KCV72794.1 hypothetical protein H696_00373 [Fonticula alba]|eukprot:XP_009492495.1 hypothetical protein H696_00373 [Fonticula alba]